MRGVAGIAGGAGGSRRPLWVVYGGDGGNGHAFGEYSAFAFESWGDSETGDKTRAKRCVLLRRAGTIVSSHVGSAECTVAVNAINQCRVQETASPGQPPVQILFNLFQYPTNYRGRSKPEFEMGLKILPRHGLGTRPGQGNRLLLFYSLGRVTNLQSARVIKHIWSSASSSHCVAGPGVSRVS